MSNTLNCLVTSIVFGPNIFLNTLFQNLYSCSSCNLRFYILDPQKTTIKTVLCILIFTVFKVGRMALCKITQGDLKMNVIATDML